MRVKSRSPVLEPGQARPRRRRARLVAIVATVVMASTGIAYAHYVYDGGFVWQNGTGKCLHVTSEISHGNGGGYAKVKVHAVRETKFIGGDIVVPEEDCSEDWPQIARYLAARPKLWKWTNQGWALCKRGSWTFNSTTTATLVKDRYYGTTTPCANGWYGTDGGGYINFNGGWVGGWMWAGCHWLPSGDNC
jgi:hypothetical protein